MSQTPSVQKDYWAVLTKDVRLFLYGTVYYYFGIGSSHSNWSSFVSYLFAQQQTEEMFESEMYRPQMEYQYIIDDNHNGEFVFNPLFLVIENDKISTQSKGGVFFFTQKI